MKKNYYPIYFMPIFAVPCVVESKHADKQAEPIKEEHVWRLQTKLLSGHTDNVIFRDKKAAKAYMEKEYARILRNLTIQYGGSATYFANMEHWTAVIRVTKGKEVLAYTSFDLYKETVN